MRAHLIDGIRIALAAAAFVWVAACTRAAPTTTPGPTATAIADTSPHAQMEDISAGIRQLGERLQEYRDALLICDERLTTCRAQCGSGDPSAPGSATP